MWDVMVKVALTVFKMAGIGMRSVGSDIRRNKCAVIRGEDLEDEEFGIDWHGKSELMIIRAGCAGYNRFEWRRLVEQWKTSHLER
jgi:hypothetical protein